MKIKRRHVFTLAFFFFALVWGALTALWGKWSTHHEWGGVPVWIWSGVAFGIVFGFGFTRGWVRKPRTETRDRFLVIVSIGFLLCAALGIGLTEPRQPSAIYDYRTTRAGVWYLGGSIDGLDIDLGDDECVLVIIVVIVVIVVSASALVPHFWVVGTAICLAIMAHFAWRCWAFDGYFDGHSHDSTHNAR